MYQLTQGTNIIRVADGACIPADLMNADYQEYKAWLDAGNIPEPFSAPSFDLQKEAFLNEVRVTREQILNRLSGIGAAAIVSGDTELQQAFVQARQALLGITSAPAVLAATDIDGLHLAVVESYRSIVSAAPETVVNAFNMVDV